MPIERVGYRRLYDAIGCSVAGEEEVRCTSLFKNGLNAELYLGPRPRFGISINQGDKYLFPGQAALLMRSEFEPDASKSSYPRHFFAEVFCWKEVEVSQEVSEAFHAKQPGAEQVLLQLAGEQADAFQAAANVIAGSIGLRFHRQFVIELINENLIAVRAENDFAYQMAGSALELLDGIRLNAVGMQRLNCLLLQLGQWEDRQFSTASTVLWWLMKAWAERDPVAKFTAFFVPLEMVLDGYSGGEQEDAKRREESIRRLITDSVGQDKDELLRFFDHLAKLRKPSLNDRFRQFAQQAAMQGWEHDAQAFNRFNRQRNGLLHKGDPAVQFIVDVTEEEVRQLEDLAERYVCYAVFGDGLVYASSNRWVVKPPVLPS